MTYSCPLDDVAWPVMPANDPLPDRVEGQFLVPIKDEVGRTFGYAPGTSISAAFFMARHIAHLMNLEAEENGDYDPLNQMLEREGRT